ncbi:hypothetical protein GOP47_0018488 [Adiantum capillus-veneris]|uniref:Suppressor of RPS4-RLD 1 n=1 Tax=Adiantum capillus-veneris TaxID=13818 RepID=A0A9D4UEJ5_ADICA|nr:hypothetical protein GOP47_0018488 [Adiantum capillus-veneris]
MAASDASLTQHELAQAYIAKEWSKAIKLLTSLLVQLPDSVELLCNRAFCHNKLELHKHAIKDCEKALKVNSAAFQAYIHKGHALVGLGKDQDALQVWKKGYETAVANAGSVELLLELHMLMMSIHKDSPMTKSGKENNADIAVPAVNKSASCSPPKTPPRQPMRSEEQPKASSRRDKDYQSFKTKRTTHVISLDLRLSRGIGMVNNGKYEQAVSIFDQVVRDSPDSVEALIGRGTAYAFQRNLDAAISDFSKALEINPETGEAWKRRGQAKAALGANAEAISDLSKALEFEPKSPDVLHERGTLLYRSKDYEAAVNDLQECVAVDASNKLAYNYLGPALLATGYHTEGIDAHYKAVEIDPDFKEGWTQLAQTFSELGKTDKALECLQKALLIDDKYVNAYRLLGSLRQGLGDHRGSVKELTSGLQIDSDNMECKYLRGSCRHALGEYADAVKDYEGVLDMEVDSIEKCVLQYLAFYQRVIALYTASRANYPFSCFDIDQDLHPLLKEAWCKRVRPSSEIFPYCCQPPVKESLRSGRVRGQDFVISRAKRSLLEAADQIGVRMQYNCQGFPRNRRQHRMAGLAALEIAQKVLNTWKAMRDPLAAQEKPSGVKSGKRARRRDSVGVISHNRGGVCSSSNRGGVCSSSSSNGDGFCGCYEDKSTSGRLILNWHDVYSIAVKWRQISEPCDPVVWVDKLSEKEFKAGFGSHTPMVLGQARVVRYYPNFPRAFAILKDMIISKRCVYDASNGPVLLSKLQLQAIEAAESCNQMYEVIGEDFWVVTPCHSVASGGKVLDGTRLTLQKMGENGFDFSIRTPGTPPRWADFDHELSAAWENLCDTFCWEASGSTDAKLLGKVQNCILKLTYYWYNFMPLARGTAAVGYITLLGLFLAVGMEITASIPEGVQVDWEAILSPNVSLFTEAISKWLYPSIKLTNAWQSLPDVSSTFPTTGSVVAALSSYDI